MRLPAATRSLCSGEAIEGRKRALGERRLSCACTTRRLVPAALHAAADCHLTDARSSKFALPLSHTPVGTTVIELLACSSTSSTSQADATPATARCSGGARRRRARAAGARCRHAAGPCRSAQPAAGAPCLALRLCSDAGCGPSGHAGWPAAACRLAPPAGLLMLSRLASTSSSGAGSTSPPQRPA